jgi:hypothetical protein
MSYDDFEKEQDKRAIQEAYEELEDVSIKLNGIVNSLNDYNLDDKELYEAMDMLNKVVERSKNG